MSETVALDYELKTPIERVWQALTDREAIPRWMFFQTDDFEPVVGRRFQLRTEPGPGWDGIIDCEVLEVEKPHRLAYTWVGGPEALQVDTKVVWTLTDAGGGVTRLHLEQSGFRSDARQAIGGAKYGWTRMLDQLQSLLSAA